MKTTYTVPQVPGSKRTSERPYTHAVIGRTDLAAARRSACSSGHDEQDRKNYAHYRVVHDAGVGGVWGHFRSGGALLVEQGDWDKAKAIIEAHPTVDSYLAAQRQMRLDWINKHHGKDAQFTPFAVLQWSMNHANARAKVGHWSKYHTQVQVVECQPVVKKTKTAA